CGKCGKACDAQGECWHGLCIPACDVHCITVNGCCEPGEMCVNDACVPGCPMTCGAGTTCCQGQCVPLSAFQSDPANCGFCGNACAAGELCLAGVCKPPQACSPACDPRTICCDDGKCHPPMYGDSSDKCCPIPAALQQGGYAFYGCGAGYDCCAGS